ncbi:MAG: PorP/SprF family type IX secretion system membrane protein [Bacteroidota bacterium]|nr:PorP/SprF family type IX secretion system membrane protein [Bacteroidota bacterium]
MKKIIIIAIGVLLCNFVTKAQDIHFSSLNYNPMFTNPAMTGFMTSKFRVSSLFRNQWQTVSKGYNTLLASIEIQPFANNKNGLGVGLSFVNDVAGELSYGERDFDFSMAYFFALNSKRNAFLSIGASLSRKSWEYDLSKARFNREETYEDNITYDKLNTLDVALGINYQYNPTEKRQFNLNFAVFNLNESKLQYFETSDKTSKIHRRYQVNTSYLFDISDMFSLRPQIMYNNQYKYHEVLYGGDVVFDLTGEIFTQNIFSLGLFVRNTEAIILAPKYKYNNFLAGLSYDVNISKLNKVSHTYGAIEFWLSYSFNPYNVKYKNNKIPCPIF